MIIVEEPEPIWLPFAERRELEELGKYTEQIKIYAPSALNRAVDAAKQAGVTCNTVQVKHAQPYQAIIATTTDLGCDLIVMASHGRSGLSAVVLGSVTNKVLTRKSRCWCATKCASDLPWRRATKTRRSSTYYSRRMSFATGSRDRLHADAAIGVS